MLRAIDRYFTPHEGWLSLPGSAAPPSGRSPPDMGLAVSFVVPSFGFWSFVLYVFGVVLCSCWVTDRCAEKHRTANVDTKISALMVTVGVRLEIGKSLQYGPKKKIYRDSNRS